MTIDSLDSSDACDSLQTALLTEMKPYTLDWTPSLFSWNGRQVSVLLPSGTQYSRGTISTKTESGYTNTQDLVDASSGIPVSRSGKVDLALVCKTQKVVNNTKTTHTQTRMVTLSLSFLEKGVSKEEYLDRLKKKNVEVLSQTDSSVITQRKDGFYSFFDTIEKTVVSGDVVLQIRFSNFESPKEPAITSTPFYRIFEKISFTTKE